MKKLITIFIFFIIIFGQLCYAAEDWVSYKNNNKIVLDKKTVSRANVTLVGLFINTARQDNKFQALNIPLKFSEAMSDFNINCNKINSSVNNKKSETNINSLTISGKIKLSPTKAASKHWLYIEIPELTSTIDYSAETISSFIGKTSTEIYKKSNFLFTTGIAPKELMPYSDRLMQRAFDFTYKGKTNNNGKITDKEKTLSMTLFASLDSVTYTDGTEWSPGSIRIAQNDIDNATENTNLSDSSKNIKTAESGLDISKATIVNNTESSKINVNDSENTSVNSTKATETDTKAEATTETNPETKNNSTNLYWLAGIILIAAIIWIFIRMKNNDYNTDAKTNHEHQEEQQKPEQSEPVKNQEQIVEVMTANESKHIEDIEITEAAKPVEKKQQTEEINTIENNRQTQQILDSETPNNLSRLNFCPECGEKIFEGATFCATCGKKIE